MRRWVTNTILLPAVQQSELVYVPLSVQSELSIQSSSTIDLLQNKTTLSMHIPTPPLNLFSNLSSMISYLKIWLVKISQTQLCLLQQTIISHTFQNVLFPIKHQKHSCSVPFHTGQSYLWLFTERLSFRISQESSILKAKKDLLSCSIYITT